MVKAGLPRQLGKYLRCYHSTERAAKIKNKLLDRNILVNMDPKMKEMLVSGAAWTLFFNSCGIIQTLGVFNRHLTQLMQKYGELTPAEKYALFVAVSEGLGLTMSGSLNPPGNCGTEFLKGMFVPATVDMKRCTGLDLDFIWTPLPSRIFKSSKKIVARLELNQTTKEEMFQRMKGVALSNSTQLLPPIWQEWVDVWSVYKSKEIKPDWEYHTTSRGQPSGLLQLRGEKEWYLACFEAIENRYELGQEDVIEMARMVKNIGHRCAFVTDSRWYHLVRRDYM